MAKTAPLEVSIGKGITAKVEEDMLYLAIDLTNNFGKSSTGKSLIIATTSGNVLVPGTNATLGLNLYQKA